MLAPDLAPSLVLKSATAHRTWLSRSTKETMALCASSLHVTSWVKAVRAVSELVILDEETASGELLPPSLKKAYWRTFRIRRDSAVAASEVDSMLLSLYRDYMYAQDI